MGQQLDLEKAIAAWRRPYERDRTFHRDDLDELEGNLRDRIDAFVASGLSEEDGFREALRRLGDYGTLEGEYRKVRWDRQRRGQQVLYEAKWRLSMLKNYLKIGLRSLRREKLYAVVTIAGLAIAMAVCLLVLLYVRYETSYDRFHSKADRIYRITEERSRTNPLSENAFSADRNVTHTASSDFRLGPALLETIPEVMDYARLFKPGKPVWLAGGDKRFYEDHVLSADPSVFRVFDFSLREGDPGTALSGPNRVVISREIARKYFGDENPIGKSLFLDGEYLLQVTGILNPVPKNSHVQFDILYSFNDKFPVHGSIYTYVLLAEGADAVQVQSKLPGVARTYLDDQHATYALNLQALTDIHLRSDLRREAYLGKSTEIGTNGSIEQVYLFSAIAALILLIACINYANLATSRAVARSREVGLRKVAGAHRHQLITQFLTESALVSCIALVVAIGLVLLLLPSFGNAIMVDVPVASVFSMESAGLALGLVLIVGLAAGSYPSFYLTRMNPALVVKGLLGAPQSSGTLRKSLVVAQFAISAVLIVATLVVQKQLDHVRNQQLGFEKEQRLVLPNTRVLGSQYRAFKDELLSLPSVERVTTTSILPTRPWFEGYTSTSNYEGAKYEGTVVTQEFLVDHDFVETLGIEMAEGRDFSEQFATDSQAVLVTEATQKVLEWDDPIGKNVVAPVWKEVNGEMRVLSTDKQVIGVIADFHFGTMRNEVQPSLMSLANGASENVVIKIATRNVPATVRQVEAVWKNFVSQPFRYSFLDDDYDSLYRAEERLANLFNVFALLSIFISCLGLFGLVSFTTAQRTKEIGIRKVLGATVSSIVALLSKDFLKLVLVAFVLAVPVAYYAMSRWLEDFAYRIELGPGVFLLAGSAALVIALATVGVHAVRAALANPVESLRYE